MKSKNSLLGTGLLVEASVLCLILSLGFINIAATIILLIFNLFFLSLIEGSSRGCCHSYCKRGIRPEIR